ncbi:hypothetical protein [Persicitalea sp.]|uniref:hypothetical protein n=1 Tax=Persicitalea sp. TaxID=3100273 RepID=UPI003592F450
MKRSLFLLFGIGLSCIPSSRSLAQPDALFPSERLLAAQISRDTLPEIRMKFEPWILAVSLLVSPLYIGGHSYKINDRKYYFASNVKPYLQTTSDPLLAELYRRHETNRIIWYSATTLGSLVAVVGVSQRIRLFYFIPYYDNSNNNYLYWAGGITLAGLGARIVCFRNMRKAVNYYNFKYAGVKPPVTLSLGLSQLAPGGVGLALRF